MDKKHFAMQINREPWSADASINSTAKMTIYHQITHWKPHAEARSRMHSGKLMDHLTPDHLHGKDTARPLEVRRSFRDAFWMFYWLEEEERQQLEIILFCEVLARFRQNKQGVAVLAHQLRIVLI